ncbi:MAG: DUF2199 domain-containing protein [Chloroflexia bacterium]
METGFYCRSCGEYHIQDDISFGAELPDPCFYLSEEERAVQCECTSDLCTKEHEGRKDYFIRGCIEIPVIGGKEPFVWGVWTSLSEQNFNRTVELLDVEGRKKESPYFGWLVTRLPLYPDTYLLKTMAHTRKVGQRPYVELEPTDHPLAIEQREGITLERVQEIVEAILHEKV